MSIDELIASVAEKVTMDDVNAARTVSEELAEDELAFGPVVMFALDKS